MQKYMKKCTKCGKTVSNSDVFCPECGSSIFVNEENINTESVIDDGENISDNDVISDKENNSTLKQEQYTTESQKQNQSYTQPTNTQYGVYQNQPNIYQAPPGAINTPSQEKASAGLVVLSVLIPLVGLILYFSQKKEKPKAAKTYGKAALISFIVALVINITTAALTRVGTSKLAKSISDIPSYSSASDDDYNYDSDYDTDEKTTAKSEKPTESFSYPNTYAAKKIIDFDNMQFAINSKAYTLGKTTFQDMLNDGVPFTDNARSKVNNVVDEYGSEFMEIEIAEDWTVDVEFSNFTKGNVHLKDCILSEISYTAYDGEKQMTLSFPFALLNMSEDDFVREAGTPTDKSLSQQVSRYTYDNESSDHKFYRSYIVTFENKKINSVTMNYMQE